MTDQSSILVVEDDKPTCFALVSWLEHAGYNVETAFDGASAIQKVEEGTFEVILSDIVLGDMSGIDVLQTAKKQEYQPEVILLTGHASIETSISALREGAYDYLLKPYEPDELLKCIFNAIQHYHHEKQLRDAAHSMVSALYGNEVAEKVDKVPRKSPPHVTEMPPNKIYQHLLQIGDLVIGLTRHEVTFKGNHVRVTPIEYAILRYLGERVGMVCLCSDIVHYTHGLTTNSTDAQTMLRSHIRNLRRKIDAQYVVNDRGIGYKIIDPKLLEE